MANNKLAPVSCKPLIGESGEARADQVAGQGAWRASHHFEVLESQPKLKLQLERPPDAAAGLSGCPDLSAGFLEIL